ncbi:TetR/AcrR family transcriptional regulator [Streptomyces thermodiastaticus]|uniref:TetR/AcrR family transcriptional regulator n=1 Tax=Streptomyces thermodiastaticus TaxID=44061 RepID=UPI00198A0747|nr:TetR/AcrR family transcriptional regulator [Streptomyces thermodiastaticus]MCE7548758.1 TetR/AcrR family transcriptional regulator [Streptomyces thermodiastaticus]GHF72537.1 TetR family transcriptional regulator [Streptomyces thermodiastaticus]
MSRADAAELRADAARNREALLQAATRTFAASATEPSMRAVAREAGVGIATLYRHFPTREALVAAVYQNQVERLTRQAGELLRRLAPSEALRAWMDLFGEWIMTKHGMVDTLRSMINSGEIAHTETRDELLAAVTGILDAGRAAGDLRSDVAADDIAAALIGIFTVTAGQSERTGRLLDLLVDGLRPRNLEG